MVTSRIRSITRRTCGAPRDRHFGAVRLHGAGFFLLLRHLDPEPIISLDTDWFYRRPCPYLLPSQRGLGRLEHIVARISDAVMRGRCWPWRRLRDLDVQVIDAAAVGVGRLTQAVSRRLSLGVSGHAQHYALVMAIGVLVAIAFVLFGS